MTVAIVSHNLMKLREALLLRAFALNEQWPSSVSTLRGSSDLHRDRREDSARRPRHRRSKTLLQGSPGSSKAVCDQTLRTWVWFVCCEAVQTVGDTKRNGCSRSPVPVAPEELGCVTPPQLPGGVCSGVYLLGYLLAQGRSQTHSPILVGTVTD